jgi:DNA ligase (NAD+)
MELPRFAEVSARNLLHSIQESKHRPLGRLIFALGMRFVGQRVALHVPQPLKNMDNKQNPSMETLIAVDDIGERIAQSVVSFFAQPLNQEVIAALKVLGINMEEQ